MTLTQGEATPLLACGLNSWMPVPARILDMKDENFNTCTIRLRIEDEAARSGMGA